MQLTSQALLATGRCLVGTIVVATVFCCGQLRSFGDSFSAKELEFFEKRIRPVLAAQCFECHSQGAEKLKASLRLDSRRGVLQGGESGAIVVPGKPEESRLIEALGYEDTDLQMPPKSKLPERTIADFRRWVELKLPWPSEPEPAGDEAAGGQEKAFDLVARRDSHWAWQPVRRTVPPEVETPEWLSNPVDAFVLKRLEEQELLPAERASRQTLIRRLYLVVTGLPPAPEELANALADDRSNYWERLVDSLLASPRFGERWARHWLDLVRYAETLGHEFDFGIPNAWRYRDYVIRAFNEDTPYDLFVQEHIAGDTLEPPRTNLENGANESWLGTGFYWLGQQVHSPVDIQMNQLDVVDNQIDVLTKTFMGLTVSCARCHDHKFDAISTKDFYSLYGMLTSSRYHEAAVDDPRIYRQNRARLETLKKSIRKQGAAAWQESASQLAEYLDAGTSLLEEPVELAPADSPSDLLFEDFEGKSKRQWTGQGKAFGEGENVPALTAVSDPTSSHLGGGYVSSLPPEGEAKENYRGTLASEPFVIERDHIHFLIAGGSDRQRTVVQLLVDGKQVRTATGNKDAVFRPSHWEVSEFSGQEATIVVKDDAEGQWGYISLDHILFSQRARVFGFQNRPLPTRQSLDDKARAAGLNAEVLERWMLALDEARSGDENHPLQAVTRLTQNIDSEATFQERWLAPRDRNKRPDNSLVDGRVMWDAAADRFEDWFFDGVAVSQALLEAGELLIDEAGLDLQPHPTFHSARWARRFQGSMRSPTFNIKERYIHVLAAGEHSRINVVMNNFNIIRSPIYGGLKKRLNHRGEKWVTIDLGRWIGNEAYLEIKDTTPGDLAGAGGYRDDGWFSVSRVVFSAASRLPRTPSLTADNLWNVALERSEGEAPDDKSVFFAQCEAGTAALLEQGFAEEPETELSRENWEWLAWLVRERLLEDQEGELSRSVAEYQSYSRKIRTPTLAPAMVEGSGIDQVVFVRGNPRSPGDPAPRNILEALSPSFSIETTGSGRRDLARQLVHPDNPLTARVYVNRVWLHLFGRGLVSSPDNFGRLGEEPSHPELLDWLADWFVNEGQWSTKRLIRLLVTSSTWRMSATGSHADAESKDPENRWWHRMNIRRLEGEAIRDAILMISGDLDLRQFGPPPPLHLTPFMTGRGRPGRNGPLNGQGRRSVYQEVRRNFISPMMLAFDTPIPFTTFGKRSVSNVPAQALILMNDPLVLHQAERWARQVLAMPLSTEARIDRIYAAALGRKPLPDEKERALSFIEDRVVPESEAEQVLEAWSDFCHVVFNIKEFIYLP